MELDRSIVLILYVFGFVLPMLGAWLAVWRARETIRTQEEGVQTSARLLAEWTEEASHYNLASSRNEKAAKALERVDAKYDRLFAEAGLITPSYDNLDPLGDRAVVRALRFVAHGNGRNALIVALGLVASTVASIWSLFLTSS